MSVIEAVTSIIPIVVDCASARRRDGRQAEGGGLLNRYTGQNLYRGFESLSLRHLYYLLLSVKSTPKSMLQCRIQTDRYTAGPCGLASDFLSMAWQTSRNF